MRTKIEQNQALWVFRNCYSKNLYWIYCLPNQPYGELGTPVFSGITTQ